MRREKSSGGGPAHVLDATTTATTKTSARNQEDKSKKEKRGRALARQKNPIETRDLAATSDYLGAWGVRVACMEVEAHGRGEKTAEEEGRGRGRVFQSARLAPTEDEEK